ncbi:MAG TPA: PQQ-dependent sugar dehydrogenase [Flavitalea sp.]|nr:PQQ-dependent sugar dehydrogenase [Flavitalea sp.]
MIKSILIAGFFGLFAFYLPSCRSGTDQPTIATDSISISKGNLLFTQQCSGCHNLRQNGIGPALSGITDSASPDWIRQFIKDPKQLIESGDQRAKLLFAKYPTVMPSFPSFNVDDLNNLVSYLHTQKTSLSKKPSDPLALKDPIPQRIPFSHLLLELEPYTQIPASSKNPPLARIVKMDIQPVTRKLFILDLRGKLYQMQHDTPAVYFDIAKEKPHFIDKPGLATGFGSFAFHPDFLNNGLLYTTHTEPRDSKKADFGFNDSIKVTLQWVLTEWKTKNPRELLFTGTPRELFRINMVAGIHGVQEIAFNPSTKKGYDYGLLYIGIGDGGAVENGHPEMVQNTKTLWGTILRIDPLGNNSKNGEYGIPISNPFAGRGDSSLGEIYAFGFRNPNHLTWTRSGQLLATNIGHANIESVNYIRKGRNYGWPIREGTFVIQAEKGLENIYPLPLNDSSYKIAYPVVQYDHDEGQAIAGGFEYTGKKIAQLRGKYLFGDIVNGRLFYSSLRDMKDGTQATVKEWKITMNSKSVTLRELCKNNRVDLRFGRDNFGEMYILTKADGKIYRLKPPVKN